MTDKPILLHVPASTLALLQKQANKRKMSRKAWAETLLTTEAVSVSLDDDKPVKKSKQ